MLKNKIKAGYPSKMLLLTDFNDIPPFEQPSGLTIGSFDGVHLGHQALLKHLRAQLPVRSPLIVLTFSNHPSSLFSPHSPTPLICSPLQKVKYLKEYGVDIVLFLPFTHEFANTPFDIFLKFLKQRLNFSCLTLGQGATLGRNKEGNEANVKTFAEKLHVQVDYLQKYLINGLPVSSGRIRHLITQGKLPEAKECLGRPYSLAGGLLEKQGKYCLHLPGLCLPPECSFPVRVKTSARTLTGHATPQHSHQIIQLDLPKDSFPILEKEVEIEFSK
jgi:riboflavin kinase/FMN adenylyltransferase